MPSVELSPEDQLQKHILSQVRADSFADITTICDFFKKKLDASDIPTAAAKIQRLGKIQITLDENYASTILFNAKCSDPKHRIEAEKFRSALNDLSDTVHAAYNKLKLDNPPAPGTSAGTKFNQAPTVIPLPKIDLPTFNGDIEEWTTFFSLFESLVHGNSSLNSIQKFQYLRTHLKGEPLATIAVFKLEAHNYEDAYNALKGRYQNQRRLASFYIQQLLNFKAIPNANSNQYQHFLTIHKNCYASLKNLSINDLNDFILFQICYNNLDARTQRTFDLKADSNALPKVDELFDHIALLNKSDELKVDSRKSAPSYKNKVYSLTAQFPKNHILSCAVCQADHKLHHCDVFKSKPLTERLDTVKQLHRCFNCLGAHSRDDCQSKSTCRSCKSRRHHSLLHQDRCKEFTNAGFHRYENPPASVSTLSCHASATAEASEVILGTMRVRIKDIYGRFHHIKAVLDPGSQISAITTKCYHRIGLPLCNVTCEISGISQASVKPLGTLQCELYSCLDQTAQHGVPLKLFVLPMISDSLPSKMISKTVKSRFQHLTLADPEFDKPSPVELLLGADIYASILSDEQQSIIKGNPSAIKTSFGWVIFGKNNDATGFKLTSLFLSTASLNRTLQQFWELEELPDEEIKAPNDVYCEEHFQRTHSRNNEGRYMVSLPFKPDAAPLQANASSALKSYHQLEKRLSNRADDHNAYNLFLYEYLSLGHMESATQPASYVLPHHCVAKQHSSTTKIRVVFNASAPDSSGLSLNERLLSGPRLQKDITEILSLFRLQKIALSADMRMMYRQIQVCPADRIYQHIFWRKDDSSSVQEYQLNTVTYGMTPSAFLAQRAIQQLVHDEGALFPSAGRALLENTYVDDIVTGADSVEEAERLQKELIELLSKGGFQLRKWATSHPVILKHLPADHLETPLTFGSNDRGFKILGIMWDSESDSFRYHVKRFEGIITKRSILSYIAKIYDPMGWLAPIVFTAKCLLQRLWMCKIGWDEHLPLDLVEQWRVLHEDLPALSQLRIPRRIILHQDIQIFGFCDASEKGYAAVIYLHCQSDASFQNYLLQGKTKVAPLKSLSIPRLELSGALLLSNLLVSAQKFLARLQISEIHLFTDSTIVLAWIHTEPHQLKTFVANRVSQIQSVTNKTSWKHVSSENNPADCASRGLFPLDLISHPLWWQGPGMLMEAWLEAPHAVPSHIPEMKSSSPVSLNVTQATCFSSDIFEKYSCFARLRRIVALMLRFIHFVRIPDAERRYGHLTYTELENSTKSLVKLSQEISFRNEKAAIAEGKTVKGSLAKLSPFLDSENNLRVGGRLQNSDLPYDSKHPYLIDKSSALASLICDYYHKSHMHAGPHILQPMIQKKFWIISLRSLLRQRIRRCMRCFRLRAQPCQPIMAPLPSHRVKISKPFAVTGVDFAGPFTVKENKLRKPRITKGYLCLFICFAVKAVHLEFVSDLTSNAFLAAFTRFVSRRGLPHEVFSDNGTNFVGASRQMREVSIFLQENSELIGSSLAERGICWKFNPPIAPNFGGLWEASIKSAKALLKGQIGLEILTFEEYCTIFCRVEAMLNSRPLVFAGAELEDQQFYLSPGHFLTGSPLFQVPENPIDLHTHLKCRWQRVNQLCQAFWSSWSKRYLHMLMQRHKWSQPMNNVAIGNLALLSNSQTSPLNWPIGKIEKVHPGPDGVVRVVTLRTSGGHVMRPVNKIVLFPESLQKAR